MTDGLTKLRLLLNDVGGILGVGGCLTGFLNGIDGADTTNLILVAIGA